MLAKNLAVLTVGEFLSRIATAIAFIHLARVLTPATYGSLELALAVMMFLTLVVDQGFGTLGAREVARRQAKVETLIRRIVSAQLLLALFIITFLAVTILPSSIERTLKLLIFGFSLPLLFYPLVIFWVFQGRDQMVWVAIPLMLRQSIFAIIALVVIREPEQALLLPLADLIAMMISAFVSIVVYIRSGERVSIDLRSGLDRSLFAEALPIGGSQMVWALRMFLPTILVGILIGPVAVALYGVAHRVVMAFQTFLEVYFKNLFPSMSYLAITSVQNLKRLMYRSILLLGIPTVGLALMITLVAPNLIDLLFGKNYLQPGTISVLGLLIWLIPILGWRRHGRNALITMSFQREELFYSVLGMGLLLGLIFPMTIEYGIVGTAISMVMSEFVTAAVVWWRVERHLKTPQRDVSVVHSPRIVKKSELENSVVVEARHEERGIRPNPIFILGAPRSGTSLLRVLLNRHPEIGICDESYFFYYVYNRRRAFGDLNDLESRRHLVSQYVSTNRIKRLGLDLERLTNVLLSEGESYESVFLSLMKFYAESLGKVRYGEKTPHHAQYTQVLCNWFPECKLVHIVRDPRDVVSSLLRMPWASKNIMTNARSWLRNNIELERFQGDKNYLLVHYENLVKNPEKELKRICEFIGEIFYPEMLVSHEVVKADKWWFQRASEQIISDRIGVWRNQLTPRQAALIESVVGSKLEYFGYLPSGHAASKFTQITASLDEYFESSIDKIRNVPRIWYHWFQPTHIAKEEAWIEHHR